MDWILKRVTDENELGLKRREGERLTNLDFADDIALLDNTYAGLQRLTNRVKEEAKADGLRINADITKVMVVGKMGSGQNIQAEGPMHDSFCQRHIYILLLKSSAS